MKHTFGKQAKRAGIALAAVVAFAALGIVTTQAAPPTAVPTFTSTKFSIETGTGAPETAAAAGSLTCTFAERGLQSFQLILYACNAAVVGAVEGCVYKNKLQGGSPTLLSIIKDPLAVLGGVAEGLISNNKGFINGSMTTPVPVSGGGHGGELCAEPAVAQVIAARWCNASLTDTTTPLVGGTAVELFAEAFAGAGTAIPSCADLLASP